MRSHQYDEDGPDADETTLSPRTRIDQQSNDEPVLLTGKRKNHH